MRRSFLVVIVVTGLCSGVLPAAALDMTEYLERSGDADFYGRQSVSCATPDGVRDAVLEVTQARGALSVRMPMKDAPTVTVSEVGTSVIATDGSVSTRIVGARSGEVAHDYLITAERGVSYERRPATEVTVAPARRHRARL